MSYQTHQILNAAATSLLNSTTAGLVVLTVISIRREPIAVTMIAIKKPCGMIPATTHGPVALVHLKVVKMTCRMRIMTEKTLIEQEILGNSIFFLYILRSRFFYFGHPILTCRFQRFENSFKSTFL